MPKAPQDPWPRPALLPPRSPKPPLWLGPLPPGQAHTGTGAREPTCVSRNRDTVPREMPVSPRGTRRPPRSCSPEACASARLPFPTFPASWERPPRGQTPEAQVLLLLPTPEKQLIPTCHVQEPLGLQTGTNLNVEGPPLGQGQNSAHSGDSFPQHPKRPAGRPRQPPGIPAGRQLGRQVPKQARPLARALSPPNGPLAAREQPKDSRPLPGRT